MASLASRVAAALSFLPLVLAMAGCEIAVGTLFGRASDEWVRTYQLAPGGEVRIGNTNGRVEIEGVDGASVEVRAERIAHATTDVAAREMLPRIVITEDVRPDRVSVETQPLGGVLVGASFEIRYRVRAPRTAVVRVTTANGPIMLTSLGGRVSARSTNGGITGRDLAGGIEAQTTNGGIKMDLGVVGSDRIELATTNGGIQLAMPEAAKASLVASCTNGGINVSGLKIELQEQSRRRVEGRINGGGTPVDLRTTNGGIRVHARSTTS